MTRPILALALVGSAACAPNDPNIELRKFKDCDEMTSYMARMAEQEVLYDWRFEVDGLPVPGASKDMSFDAAEDAGGTASSYSTTNIQEEGVDESDLVKTDGAWLYSLSGDALVVSRTWNDGPALEQTAVVEIDGSPSGIYLYGDLVVVESQLWGTASPRSGVAPTHASGSYWEARTLITVVDVTDPTAPEVVRETYANGELVESRRIDNRLFVVTYQDVSVGVDADNAREAKKAVRNASQTDWLPWIADNMRLGDKEWATDEAPACDCVDVWASEREGGTYLVSALSVDLDDPTSEFQGSAVVGQAETVYASPGAIYVASSEYEEGPFPSIDGTLQTIIHKFDLTSEAGQPQYKASAKVLGTLDDRFGLSEHQGVLRVATTEWVDESSAVVTTLQERGGEFDQLDSLGDIGLGESIFATRFTGEVGYVVTYEQIDPLFAIDLSDPANIRLGGSLEMEGWSDYLHPMGDDHLLSVGVDGDWHLAVNLFDVSDIEAPRLVDQLSFEGSGSEALYESHAFNYFADQDALVIPSDDYYGHPGLESTKVTVEGFDYQGRLDQEAVLEAWSQDEWCVPIRRSVIFEDKVFAVSAGGITAAALTEPETVLDVAVFSGVEPCAGYYDDYYYDSSW